MIILVNLPTKRTRGISVIRKSGVYTFNQIFYFPRKATVEELCSLLVSLGFDEVQIRKPSTIATLLAFLTQGGQFLAILVFLITYMALVVIANVRQLRTAGIRLIAGDSRWHLFLLSLQENAKEIALTIPFVVLPAVGLAYLIGLDGYSVYYLVALVGYHFLLGLIVLFSSLHLPWPFGPITFTLVKREDAPARNPDHYGYGANAGSTGGVIGCGSNRLLFRDLAGIPSRCPAVGE